MAKKEMDKLSLDMIECEKAGYGVHYGAWKAAQTNQTAPVVVEQKIPEGWLVCEYCGKAFKPKTKRPQRFCEVECQNKSYQERHPGYNSKKVRECRERKRSEANKQ